MKKFLIPILTFLMLNSFSYAEIQHETQAPLSSTYTYMGLSFSLVSTRDSAVNLNFFSVTTGQDRLGNVSFLAGYNFKNIMAIEGRYSINIIKSDLVTERGWSIFLKPQYPVNDDFKVYALFGYGGVTMEPENNSIVNVDSTGLQWGFGIDYKITERSSIFFDYTSLASGMEGLYYNGALQIDTDALTVGFKYAF